MYSLRKGVTWLVMPVRPYIHWATCIKREHHCTEITQCLSFILTSLLLSCMTDTTRDYFSVLAFPSAAEWVSQVSLGGVTAFDPCHYSGTWFIRATHSQLWYAALVSPKWSGVNRKQYLFIKRRWNTLTEKLSILLWIMPLQKILKFNWIFQSLNFTTYSIKHTMSNVYRTW